MPDVPSPIDLRSMEDAREWAQAAMAKRPWRKHVFDTIVGQLPIGKIQVLDIGSGPGFLAERILQARPDLQYVALDFSSAMHTLAKERLGDEVRRVQFIERDFRYDGWTLNLPRFDFVVTVQAVHELRHKKHAPNFYQVVCDTLLGDGVFLMCDHFAGDGGMSDTELFMTPEEQADALKAGGFANPVVVLRLGGLILFRALANKAPCVSASLG